MIQETFEIIDFCKYNQCNREITHDRQIASGETIHVTKTEVSSETIQGIFLHAHTHRISFHLGIYVYVGVMNIPAKITPYATCHVFDGLAHNIHLQIANLPFN